MTRSVELLQQTLQTHLHRFKNFLGFSRGFLIRRNPLKTLTQGLVDSLKSFLTIKKKLKLAQYRVNYHRNQLNKMETLIAKNNEHMFLKGKNINEVR